MHVKLVATLMHPNYKVSEKHGILINSSSSMASIIFEALSVVTADTWTND